MGRCPYCGGDGVARVRGLQGPLEVLVALVLLCLLILPGVVFYAIREATPYCTHCGRRVPRRYLRG